MNKLPKICIIRVPVTLCRLTFIQVYEEVSIPAEQVGTDLLEVIKDSKTFYKNKLKFENALMDKLRLSGFTESPDTIRSEVDWLINWLLKELKEAGIPIDKGVPFNSMTPSGGDSFVLVRVNKHDVL